MNKVTTTSSCGRCGAQDVREGAHPFATPVGWALGLLNLKTISPTVETLFDGLICPACQDAVLAVLKPVKPPCSCNGSGRLPCSIAGECLPGCFYGHQAEAPDA